MDLSLSSLSSSSTTALTVGLAVEFGREDGLDELEDFLASFAMWMICLGGVGGTGLLVVEGGLALKTESGGSLLFSEDAVGKGT